MSSSRGLLDTDIVEVTSAVLDQSWAQLSAAGELGYEAFVVWAGSVVANRCFRFDLAIVPRQRSLITDEGALVSIDGKSMFECNRTAFEHGRIIAGQIHSHPKEAFHSQTDDRFPLATLLGSVSVVVQDFASGDSFDCFQWAWYRLVSAGRWLRFDPQTSVRVIS